MVEVDACQLGSSLLHCLVQQLRVSDAVLVDVRALKVVQETYIAQMLQSMPSTCCW